MVEHQTVAASKGPAAADGHLGRHAAGDVDREQPTVTRVQDQQVTVA